MKVRRVLRKHVGRRLFILTKFYLSIHTKLKHNFIYTLFTPRPDSSVVLAIQFVENRKSLLLRWPISRRMFTAGIAADHVPISTDIECLSTD